MPSMTLTCAICNLPMWRGKGSKPQGEAAHNACRRNVLEHGESGYAKGCRCEVCRAGKNEAMRKYGAGRRARDGIGHTAQYKRTKRGIDPLAIVKCWSCGEPLMNVRSNQSRYPLHKACRQTAPEWMRRGHDKPLSAKRVAFERKIQVAARGTSGGKRVFVHGGCAWCTETFTAAAGVYCSDKCKVSASFKRRSGGKSFSVSPRVRAAIYERDSWTCQLCNYPVDASLNHRHNWAGSLDHIVPQSHMLIPDHSPSNLRLVHRMCNSLRGDGSNVTEIEFHRRIKAYFEGVAA